MIHMLMKKTALRFGPWVLLLAIGTIATPRFANTAPPPPAHPHIEAAVNELRQSRVELEKAAHDFCGHRAEALRDTDAALKQLQEALRCAR
jgi:hypothetical protein